MNELEQAYLELGRELASVEVNLRALTDERDRLLNEQRAIASLLQRRFVPAASTAIAECPTGPTEGQPGPVSLPPERAPGSAQPGTRMARTSMLAKTDDDLLVPELPSSLKAKDFVLAVFRANPDRQILTQHLQRATRRARTDIPDTSVAWALTDLARKRKIRRLFTGVYELDPEHGYEDEAGHTAEEMAGAAFVAEVGEEHDVPSVPVRDRVVIVETAREPS